MISRIARLASLVMPACLAAAGIAAADGSRRFEADAFRSSAGPTLRLAEVPHDPNGSAGVISAMRVRRPAATSVAAPRRGARLGTLEFFIAPATAPSSPGRRELVLRRKASLAEGKFVIGRASGASVVLSTRDRSAFLRISLPAGARNVTATLKGDGARLLKSSGCRTMRFAARFTLRSGSVSDGDSISGARLRRAGLC